MTWAISRHYQRDDFSAELSLEDKITIFADRVRGWLLYPAEEIIETVPHSGLVVLFTLMQYFEAIAKFMEGFTEEGQSEAYFKKGLKDAADYLFGDVSDLTDEVANGIYKEVRCGLYHTGLAGSGIVLTSHIDAAIEIQNKRIVLNCHKLVPALQQHFDAYMKKLSDPNENTLRQNFEARFDYGSR